MEQEMLQRLVTNVVREMRLPSRSEGRGSHVLTLVDAVLDAALDEEATDIHLEPVEEGLRIRVRVDGLLRPYPSLLPAAIAPVVIARLKVMAGIDTAKRNRPQDGQIRYPHGERSVDMRVAVLPVVGGERMVVRIMDGTERFLHCRELGFTPENEAIFERLIHRPTGLLLVCGPMNSGKTTTLYAALSEINTPERNIMTIEDPPEYRIEGVNQIQVNKKTGMTYAAGLRAMLRSDIDEIVLGEIRDAETAEMAVRAALTGHLLFSTLHTKDALGAVFRLLDMGVPAYLLAAALTGVVAQRLVRRLCPHCRELSEEALPAWAEGVSSTGRLWRAAGCASCGGTGFSGRLALQELLVVDAALQQAIVHRAGLEEMRELAGRQGMRTLAEDGIEKALQGRTTLSEVVRVLYGEADAADFSGTFSGAARGDCGGADDGGV